MALDAPEGSRHPLGIAGPGGATARKPVGLVYIALSSPNEAIIEEHHFPGDRAAVVDAAAEYAQHIPMRIVAQRTPALSILGSLGVGIALFGGSVFTIFFNKVRQIGRAHV